MSEKSILLLDPFKNLLNAYRMVFEEEGYLVDTATETKEAFHQFSTRHYTILITEFFPPFEETSRLIQWVKQYSPETYIIMVTNLIINDTTYGKLFEMGLDDLILKPYSAERILAHVRRGLRQKDLMPKKNEFETHPPLDSISQLVQQNVFSPINFTKSFRQELKRARRHHRLLSLILIRIPSKEEIGDRYEKFYLEMAKILRKYVREEDTVGKENGNLGIILPETDQAGSHAVLKRLLDLIKAHPSFISDGLLRPIVQALDFESYTYPEKFVIPGFLKAVVDEINSGYS
jgi:PleD family two-component response regulator